MGKGGRERKGVAALISFFPPFLSFSSSDFRWSKSLYKKRGFGLCWHALTAHYEEQNSMCSMDDKYAWL